MDAAHRSLQWNTVLFSQLKLILLSSILLLIPHNFVGSVGALYTKCLEVCISIRKGV